MSNKPKPSQKQLSPADKRALRLAEQLRANLKKRKSGGKSGHSGQNEEPDGNPGGAD